MPSVIGVLRCVTLPVQLHFTEAGFFKYLSDEYYPMHIYYYRRLGIGYYILCVGDSSKFIKLFIF